MSTYSYFAPTLALIPIRGPRLGSPRHLACEALSTWYSYIVPYHLTYLIKCSINTRLSLSSISYELYSSLIAIMSRSSIFGQRDVNPNPASAAQRNLTLTEELEKLEQSITLTLQGNSTSGAYGYNVLILLLRDRSQF